ncbi:hypothetical protein C8R46DRAFT_466357 [Mycena filopes]|nr:hypothetical protein C8R46DRAFT_466357 [Mycena filopes]
MQLRRQPGITIRLVRRHHSFTRPTAGAARAIPSPYFAVPYTRPSIRGQQGILWNAARRLAWVAERHFTFPVYFPDVVAQGATDWLLVTVRHRLCQAGSEGLAWLPLAQITLREDVRRIPERGDAASSTFEDLCFRSDFPPMAVAVLLYTGHGTRPRPSHHSCPPTKYPRGGLFERTELYRVSSASGCLSVLTGLRVYLGYAATMPLSRIYPSGLDRQVFDAKRLKIINHLTHLRAFALTAPFSLCTFQNPHMEGQARGASTLT